MSLNNPASGQRVTRDVILDVDTEVTLYEIPSARQNQTAVIESIWVTSTATGAALDMSVKSGSTMIFPIFIAQDVDQTTYQPMVKDYHRTLRNGQKLTVQADVADELSVSVVLFQSGGN